MKITPVNLERLEDEFAENPLDIDLLLELARCYLSQGVFNMRSRAVYEKALMAAPRQTEFRDALHLSVFLRQLRRLTVDFPDSDAIDSDAVSDLIPVLQRFLGEHAKSADLFFALGDLHMLKGNVLAAIGAYESAVKLGLNDLRPIIRTYELASRMHSLPPTERTYFARLYEQLGLEDEALQVYRNVVEQGFYDEPVIEALIRLLKRAVELETNKNAANKLRMEVVELHLLAGNEQAALADFAEVQFPINQDHALVKRIAEILIGMQDYRQAFDYLSQIPVDEENKSLLNRIAAELERIGELDTAGFLLKFINENDLVIREARALREKEMEIHTELAVAELNYSNRRFDAALVSYARVLQMGYKDDLALLAKIMELLPLITQDHLQEFHVIGRHFYEKRDYYRAMQFYQMARERRPDDRESLESLRRIYDRLLERNSNLPELRLRSGDLYLDENLFENAIAEYKHAAQFPETNVEATRSLAVTYMRLHNFTQAVEAFQSIPSTDIDLENLYDLHLIMMERKHLPEALNLLNTIRHVDENYRDVRDRLQVLHAQLDRESEKISVDPRMRDLIGDVAVGRYRYMEKIGSGGMGVVHKVFDQKLNRPVAMKILREGLANSSKAIERFFREARIAATLNHRNIVNIFDYNINQQTHRSFISMEYVEGKNLREMFEDYFAAADQPFSMRLLEALFYMSQICDALQMTHSKGIIHRDIKPDNILISRDRIAKITDFGIVHIEEANFTPTGAVIGTPRYMSPEQVQGTRLDGRADLYSAGIILYEWLVGMPPFISGDIAYQQVNMPPSPPMEQNSEVPEDVNDIVLKCLEKNPADRFQKAMDLKEALERAKKRLAPEGLPHLEQPEDRDLDTIL